MMGQRNTASMVSNGSGTVANNVVNSGMAEEVVGKAACSCVANGLKSVLAKLDKKTFVAGEKEREGGEREYRIQNTKYRPRQSTWHRLTLTHHDGCCVPCWSTKVWLFTSMCNKDVVPIEWFIGVMVVLM